MILCLSVCFLLPWKRRHRVRLVGQYRTWTIWQYRSIWLIYELSSPRVRETANWLTIELPWTGKSSILVHPSIPYPNPNLTPVHGNRKGKITKCLPFKLDPATSRTSLLTQWLRPPVKCCLWITEWLNRVRVRVMVNVRVSVRVVVRVRVLSVST